MRLLLVILSFVVAFMLLILPLPDLFSWLRPCWVAMVLIYWLLRIPNHLNVGFAWCIGLLVDALTGSVLGAHALALTVVAFLTQGLMVRLQLINIWQKTSAVFVIVLSYQATLFVIYGMVGLLPNSWAYWLASFTSVLFWPWLYMLLMDCEHRLKVVKG